MVLSIRWYSLCLLYWYKSTNTDAEGAFRLKMYFTVLNKEEGVFLSMEYLVTVANTGLITTSIRTEINPVDRYDFKQGQNLIRIILEVLPSLPLNLGCATWAQKAATWAQQSCNISNMSCLQLNNMICMLCNML